MRFLLWILFPFSCSADQGQSECPPDHWSNYGFCNAFGNPGLQCNAHCKPRLVICQAPNEVMKVRLITWSAYEWTCDLRMQLVGKKQQKPNYPQIPQAWPGPISTCWSPFSNSLWFIQCAAVSLGKWANLLVFHHLHLFSSLLRCFFG